MRVVGQVIVCHLSHERSNVAPAVPVGASSDRSLCDVADQHVALGHVRLGDHPLLAAAIAHNPEEPRRERAQGLVQGLLARWQRIVAVGPPVPSRDRPGHHQEPSGRIMRAISALTSGGASWPSSTHCLRRAFADGHARSPAPRPFRRDPSCHFGMRTTPDDHRHLQRHRLGCMRR